MDYFSSSDRVSCWLQMEFLGYVRVRFWEKLYKSGYGWMKSSFFVEFVTDLVLTSTGIFKFRSVRVYEILIFFFSWIELMFDELLLLFVYFYLIWIRFQFEWKCNFQVPVGLNFERNVLIFSDRVMVQWTLNKLSFFSYLKAYPNAFCNEPLKTKPIQK